MCLALSAYNTLFLLLKSPIFHNVMDITAEIGVNLILQVEQLHKIFKLCGSPPEEYWKNSKLPHATMFKPQYSYESSLRERCKEFPTTSVGLLQTLLSVEPYKRGTASSALLSEVIMVMKCDLSNRTIFK